MAGRLFGRPAPGDRRNVGLRSPQALDRRHRGRHLVFVADAIITT